MPLSPRLERALSTLRALARDGVVEAPAHELAVSLGCAPRTVRSLVLRLERSGSVGRENLRGERLRLTLRTATTHRVERQGERQERQGERQAEGGRGEADLAVLSRTEDVQAAAAAQLVVDSGERQERQVENGKNGKENGKLRLVIEGDPLLLADLLARLGRVSRDTDLDVKPSNVLEGDLTVEESLAVAERFAQLRDAGEGVRNHARLTELVVADCRRSPAILAGLLRSADERRDREEKARAARERLAEQRADEQRRARALLAPNNPKDVRP